MARESISRGTYEDAVRSTGENRQEERNSYMETLRLESVKADSLKKRHKLEERFRKQLQKEEDKARLRRNQAEREEARKSLLERWKEEAAFRKEQAAEELEHAIAQAKGTGEITKAAFKYGAQVLNEAAATFASKAGAALMGSVDKYLDNYVKYMSAVDARIQGAYDGMTFETLNDVIRQNTSGSPYVKYTAVLDNLAALVKEGVASNLTQRAFLATISDKIATTFNALDANLLRMVRIQQQDSTAGRLGMEASLTRLFNHYFSDTSYLSQAFDNVTGALTDLSAQLSMTSSVELEYVVQKWLGSLGSVGVDESTLSTIAQAINALGSGQIDWLTSNTAMQNLLVMAANRQGLSYSDMLVSGVNSQQVNRLLYGVIDYIQDVTSGANNVVKAQYAELFGLTMADIAAFDNISESVMNSLYASAMTYTDTLTELDNQLREVPNRIHLSEQIDNVIDNILAATGINIASNRGMYATYKIADMVQSLTGGIKIPTISVLGTSITLPNSIEEYVKMGVVGISTMTSLFDAVGNWATGSGLNRTRWISSWDKGDYTGYVSLNELQTTTSSTGFVSNTNNKGLQQSIMDEQKKSAEDVTGEEPEETTEMLEYIKAIKTYIEQSATGTVPLKISFAVPKATSSADSNNKQPTDPVVLLQNILSRLLTMGTDEYPVVTTVDTDLTNNRIFTLPEGIGTEW